MRLVPLSSLIVPRSRSPSTSVSSSSVSARKSQFTIKVEESKSLQERLHRFSKSRKGTAEKEEPSTTLSLTEECKDIDSTHAGQLSPSRIRSFTAGTPRGTRLKRLVISPFKEAVWNQLIELAEAFSSRIFSEEEKSMLNKSKELSKLCSDIVGVVDLRHSAIEDARSMSLESVTEICKQANIEIPKQTIRINLKKFANVVSGESIADWIAIYVKTSMAESYAIADFAKDAEIILDVCNPEKKFHAKGYYHFNLSGTGRTESFNQVWLKVRIELPALCTRRVRKGLKVYENAIQGSDLLRWLEKEEILGSKQACIEFCAWMVNKNVIRDISEAGVSEDKFLPTGVYSISSSPRSASKVYINFQSFLFGEVLSCDVFLGFVCMLEDDDSLLLLILQYLQEFYENDLNSMFDENQFMTEWKELGAQFDSKPLETWIREETVIRLSSLALGYVLLSDSEFLIEKLNSVFTIPCSESFGRACDLIWELVKNKLNETHFCLVPRACEKCLSIELAFKDSLAKCLPKTSFCGKHTLYAIASAMIDSFWSQEKPVIFNQSVQRTRLWIPYFQLLNHAEEAAFLDHIRDAFSLLSQNTENCVELSKLPHWEDSLLSYLDSSSEEMQKYILATIANVITEKLLYLNAQHKLEAFGEFWDDLLVKLQVLLRMPISRCIMTYRTFNSFLALLKNHAVSHKIQMNPELISILFESIFQFIFCSKEFVLSIKDLTRIARRPTAEEIQLLKERRRAVYGIHLGHEEKALGLLKLLLVILQRFRATIEFDDAKAQQVWSRRMMELTSGQYLLENVKVLKDSDGNSVSQVVEKWWNSEYSDKMSFLKSCPLGELRE